MINSTSQVSKKSFQGLTQRWKCLRTTFCTRPHKKNWSRFQLMNPKCPYPRWKLAHLVTLTAMQVSKRYLYTNSTLRTWERFLRTKSCSIITKIQISIPSKPHILTAINSLQTTQILANTTPIVGFKCKTQDRSRIRALLKKWNWRKLIKLFIKTPASLLVDPCLRKSSNRGKRTRISRRRLIKSWTPLRRRNSSLPNNWRQTQLWYALDASARIINASSYTVCVWLITPHVALCANARSYYKQKMKYVKIIQSIPNVERELSQTSLGGTLMLSKKKLA